MAGQRNDESPHDVYAKNLISKTGYPLWIPEPTLELPESYKEEGLRIGDVGLIDPNNGSFDVLFNICFSPTHDLHCGGVPDNFVPITLEQADIAFIPNVELPRFVKHSSSVLVTVPALPPSSTPETSSIVDYQFSLPPGEAEGAVLILPEGADRYDLRNEQKFLDEVIQHAVDWYKFAERRRIMYNASLYLITGLHKACSWSLAIFQNHMPVRIQEYSAKFRETGPRRGDISAAYTWWPMHGLHPRVGPAEYTGRPNQTVIIRGFRIMVNEELLHWKRVTIKNQQERRITSKLVGFGSGFANFLFPASETEEAPEGNSQQPVSGGSKDAAFEEPATQEQVIIHRIPPISQVFHPSDRINRYLLVKEPSATVAITHDNLWIRLLDKSTLGHKDLIQGDRLDTILSENCDVSSCDGAVYLQNKINSNITFNDSKISRNIVFFGETGAGKSSTINLLLDSGAVAAISNDAQACTRHSARYETRLRGIPFILWDTRGLGEGSGFFQNLFGTPRSEKELKKFLEERHRNYELDLLVYCVRGSRAIKASLKYYNTFCAITRRLAAPVVIVVTDLEREADMEDWWKRNSPSFEGLKMEFDGYACITSLSGHRRTGASREALVKLLSRRYRWGSKAVGSYFGSPVPGPVAVTSGRASGLFKGLKKSRRPISDSDIPRPDLNVDSAGPSIPASSTRYSGFYSPIEPPQKSRSSTPTVQPPTPSAQERPLNILSSTSGSRPSVSPSEASIVVVPHIRTDLLRPPRPRSSHSEDTDDVESTSSMFYASHPESATTRSAVAIEPQSKQPYKHLAADVESTNPMFDARYQESVPMERPSDQPYNHITATVRRKQGYATRSGSFGDIWECELIEGGHSRTVAVKAIKILQSTGYDSEELSVHEMHEKKFRREAKVWERLQHKNLVPLIGLVAGFGALPSLVIPWFVNGSLTRYLSLHTELKLSQRRVLLRDIAAGLCYLHNQGVVHGDIHSENVLIDDNGRACLTDFGLTFIADLVGAPYLKSSFSKAIRFADPALVIRAIQVEDRVVYPTKPCDIYSFGGLMLHVLTGREPYDGLRATTILGLVLKEERPHIPADNQPWRSSVPLIRMCWDPEERKRPSAKELSRWFPEDNTRSVASPSTSRVG